MLTEFFILIGALSKLRYTLKQGSGEYPRKSGTDMIMTHLL
jgi:hypothetical protein